ncbi:type IV secretion system DNA-binding domain-containing protein [Candidatus Kaiserbacteria bacterium]|nr:type IV secretion system DNA-binding domain-containing protein [Candidatus Kaiserbacteria bacterium]
MSTFDPEKITFFAKTDARGQEVPFGIKAKDRQRHMYVVGKTGMGKSTLLENMAAQDILNGEGMAFIDPHGSAAETLLEYVPEHRVRDVVYFAPFDTDYPISFNVMEDVGPDKRHLVVSGLMSTFKKIWVDAWSARMEYILTNALLALIEYPDTTLLSVNRLFIDKAYRDKVVDYVKDPAVKAYWTEEFANYTERFAAEALPAIQNKIGQFTGNPLIRNIIGQPHSSFDIRKLMDEKKILIMNLSKGLIGETNANLLGSMLTTRIYLAAMSRADLPVAQMKQMPNFYFYVDEFQSFANSTFANILSEARKYHLNLIIAHQYIAQMEEEVRDAVFGNVGTTVAFRVGPFDGEVLETVFQPTFMATDLVNLGFAQIYLTLMIDGIGSQPFSATTLPPIQTPPVSHRGQVTSSSRKLYADTRDTVEALVNKLHTPEPKPEKDKESGGKDNADKKTKKPAGGSKSFAGKSDGKSEARPAPASQQKTSDDLRAVLAKMTGAPNKFSNNDRQSSDVVTDTQPKTEKPVPPHAPNPVTKLASTEKPTERKSVKTSALAEALQAAGLVTNKQVSRSETPTPAPRQAVKPAPGLRSALSAALAEVPQKTAQPLPTPPINRVPKILVETKQTTERPTPTPQPEDAATTTFSSTQTDSSPQSAPYSKPPQHFAPRTAELSTAPDVAFDTTTIKKMLQQSGNERSPFAS